MNTVSQVLFVFSLKRFLPPAIATAGMLKNAETFSSRLRKAAGLKRAIRRQVLARGSAGLCSRVEGLARGS